MLAQIFHTHSNNQPVKMEIITSLHMFTRTLVREHLTGTVKTHDFVTLM